MYVCTHTLFLNHSLTLTLTHSRTHIHKNTHMRQRSVVQRLLDEQPVVRLARLRDRIDVLAPRLHLLLVAHVHAQAAELHVEQRLVV
jgi:hypothetical protein